MVVTQLWRFPVKSLGGEELEVAEFEAGGIPFDRRYVVLDSDPTREGRPLTARRKHRMIAFRASARGGRVIVHTPSGQEYDVADRRWLHELEHQIGQPATLQATDEPVHDGADILVLNAASLRQFARDFGMDVVDPLRFRPNIIVDGPGARPLEELTWPGNEFTIGGATLRAVKACGRCVLTTYDPKTLENDPSFLRFIVEKRMGQFGVYCSVVRGGTVKKGDQWSQRPARADSNEAMIEGSLG